MSPGRVATDTQSDKGYGNRILDNNDNMAAAFINIRDTCQIPTKITNHTAKLT